MLILKKIDETIVDETTISGSHCPSRDKIGKYKRNINATRRVWH